jgi:hypothetical protein
MVDARLYRSTLVEEYHKTVWLRCSEANGRRQMLTHDQRRTVGARLPARSDSLPPARFPRLPERSDEHWCPIGACRRVAVGGFLGPGVYRNVTGDTTSASGKASWPRPRTS